MSKPNNKIELNAPLNLIRIELERALEDVETLKKLQKDLLETLVDIEKISTQAQVKRRCLKMLQMALGSKELCE